MRTHALWLSNQEYVEIEPSSIPKMSSKNREPLYKAKRSDGSIVMIGRKDILFQEERELIQELALIVIQRKFKANQDRYAYIMRYLLRNGVPFSATLEALVSGRAEQQTLNFGSFAIQAREGEAVYKTENASELAIV